MIVTLLLLIRAAVVKACMECFTIKYMSSHREHMENPITIPDIPPIVPENDNLNIYSI